MGTLASDRNLSSGCILGRVEEGMEAELKFRVTSKHGLQGCIRDVEDGLIEGYVEEAERSDGTLKV